jgi:hypothetical protein
MGRGLRSGGLIRRGGATQHQHQHQHQPMLITAITSATLIHRAQDIALA